MKGKHEGLLEELRRSPFWKGLLIGGIAVALLFVSWRFVLLILGALAVWYLLRKRD